jgi:hypothetical protein
MVTEKDLELLKELFKTVDGAAQNILIEYTKWEAADAFVGVIMGIIFLIFAGVGFFTACRENNLSKEEEGILFFIVLLAGGFGLLLIGTNMADLMEPRAVAIHRLLTDVMN